MSPRFVAQFHNKNTYFFSLVSLCKHAQFIVFDQTVVNALFKRLFLLFYYSGMQAAAFYTIAQKQYQFSINALNFAIATRYGQPTLAQAATQFLSMDSIGLQQLLLSTKIQFIFVLDYDTNHRLVTRLARHNIFLVGACYNALDLNIFDIALPIFSVHESIHFFLLEFILFAVMLGRQRSVLDFQGHMQHSYLRLQQK